jgi:hypothetical protein
VPKIVLLGIVLIWGATVKHDVSFDHFIVEFIFVALLLAVLFYAEALEIAYTFLSEKNADEFPESDRKTIDEMKTRPDLVYEAREWLVIAIVVIITLTTEFRTIYFPFVGAIPNLTLPIVYNNEPLVISSARVFSILFTTVPIIWFAQGPAKTVGRLASQTTIRRSRFVWWTIKKVGAVVGFFGLSIPAEYMGNELLKRSFGTTNNLIPSDQGFFFAALQRYGFALHDLCVTVRLRPDGSCTMTQKFALYLVRYPRSSFFRQMRFPAAKALPPDTFSVKCFECKSAVQNYEDFCELLKQIAGGTQLQNVNVPKGEIWSHRSHPLDKDGNLTGKAFTEAPFPVGVRFGINMDRPLPPKGAGAFVFILDWSGKWEGEAFFTKHLQDDYFEMRFDYPCRSYELLVLRENDPNIHFKDVVAEATLMNNLHKGETDRLESAVKQEYENPDTLLHAFLLHPLPGTQYKLKWTVRREEEA